jgi:iron-sulfur cluster assembly protein
MDAGANQSNEQNASQTPGAESGIPITLTAKAIEMTKKAIAEEGLTDHGLRVAVRGGGCSGLEYALDFADAARPGDSVFEVEGLKIFIDMASLQFLKGTEIDYVSGLQGSGFKFKNPNAKRSCGCGHSFS